MAYDRIPGVDENYRFPPEVEGGVEQAMLNKAVSHTQATNPNQIVKTNGQGVVTTNTPWSNPQIVPKSYVDSRVPVNLPITEDNSVGKRIFIGDTMVYGDTGQRDVTTEDPEVAIRFHRIGKFIACTSENPTIQGVGVFTITTIPEGFRPVGVERLSYSERSGDFPDKLLVARRTSGSALQAYNKTEGTGLYISVMWLTKDPWPTSLPGTPA